MNNNCKEIVFGSDTAERKRYQKNFPPCPKCGTPMNTRSKTCARCAGKGRGSLSRKRLVVRKCKFCRNNFSIPLWRQNQNRGYFCSRECVNKYQKTLIGVKSRKWRGGTNPRFGSRSTAWKVAKLWAMAREKRKCQKCHKIISGFNAIIHHIKPYSKCKDHIEAFGPQNIMLLCRSCHAKIENLGRNKRRKGGDAYDD